MPLTVAAIAELIRRPDVDKAAVIERLRHWSTEGLLKPLGDRNPGTGRPRFYDESAVFDAAILNVLADLGFPIGKQRYYLVVLDLAQRAKELWEKKSFATLYLEVADFVDPGIEGGTHAVFLHEGKKRAHIGSVIHPRAEASLIVNVTRLFARIEKRMSEQGVVLVALRKHTKSRKPLK
jgi:DNA-binding transcriptional MerR regulator